MNWNKELDKLSDILKEEKNANTNISITPSDSINSNSDNNISIRDIHRKLIKEREVNKVITVEAALGDLDKIAKNTELDATSKIIEAVKVLIKFLSTMRSNQLLGEADKAEIRRRKAEKEVKKVE